MKSWCSILILGFIILKNVYQESTFVNSKIKRNDQFNNNLTTMCYLSENVHADVVTEGKCSYIPRKSCSRHLAYAVLPYISVWMVFHRRFTELLRIIDDNKTFNVNEWKLNIFLSALDCWESMVQERPLPSRCWQETLALLMARPRSVTLTGTSPPPF